MKYLILFILIFTMSQAIDLKHYQEKANSLTPQEYDVIVNKATEAPYTGKLLDNKKHGIYSCKLCGSELYKSNDKFNSNCGWPSFDDEIDGAVKHLKDADGRRVEIVCATCNGHLGHVFEGEGFTRKNVRHCVNSISLDFKEVKADENIAKAYFAGGCFWGVEYYLEKLDGVKEVISGFMGGHIKNPSYHEVIRTDTGHLETVEVIYDKTEISFKQIAKTFFEIHDPTQRNGQGPDIGKQYLSAVFVNNSNEKETTNELIKQLRSNGYDVATKILDADEFYEADESHQDYYDKKGTLPYCHKYTKRF